MTRTKKYLLLAGTLAVAAVLVTGTAIAASGGAGTSPSAFLDSLATHLGISREKLDDAVKAAGTDQVDAALAAGTITKEQADDLKARIESGQAPAFGFGHGGFGHHGGTRGFGQHLSAAATYLGLTEAELRTQLASGKSLKQVAEAQGKSVAGLKQALIASEKAELAEAVKAGRITEAQAAEILARFTERVDDLIDGTFSGPGHGPGGFGMGPGFGMRHDGMGRAPDASGLVVPAWGTPA
jgi:hypothetical protein